MTGDTQGKVTLAAYTYDELGRRQGKKLHNGLYDASYTYNVAGEMTGFTSRDLTWMLSYDELAKVPKRFHIFTVRQVKSWRCRLEVL